MPLKIAGGDQNLQLTEINRTWSSAEIPARPAGCPVCSGNPHMCTSNGNPTPRPNGNLTVTITVTVNLALTLTLAKNPHFSSLGSTRAASPCTPLK